MALVLNKNNEIRTFEQGRLTFTLSPSRVIVRTSMQTFFLLPRESFWHKRLRLIRLMIELGEIRDLNELAEFCGQEIEWRSTSASIAQLVYNGSEYGRQQRD